MTERHDRLDAVLGAALGGPGPHPGGADLEIARHRFLRTLQQRRRRRTSLAGGAVLAVAVSLGTLAAVGDLSGPSSTTSASPPTAATARRPGQPACRLDHQASQFSCGNLFRDRGSHPSETPVAPNTSTQAPTSPFATNPASSPVGTNPAGAGGGANTATAGSTLQLRVGQVLTVTLPGAARRTGPVTTTGGVAVTSPGRRELRITARHAGDAVVSAPVGVPSCSGACHAVKTTETLTINLEVST